MKINEFDHPDHGWKWQECEVRWVEAEIAEAVAAERKTCEVACAQALIYAREAERKACADLCDDIMRNNQWTPPFMCAVEIRKRGNHDL